MDLSLILNVDHSYAPLKQDAQPLEDIFVHYAGNVPSYDISQITKQRHMDREVVRMWFLNRRMKAETDLVRRYKILKRKLSVCAKKKITRNFRRQVNDCFDMIDDISTLYIVSSKFSRQSKQWRKSHSY